MAGGTVNQARGFTLLEVLVALTVLAIALGALVKSGAEQARTAAFLKEKSVAHWVALNKVAELQLAPQWPALGNQRDSEEMAGHEWDIQVTVAETFDDRVRQLTVAVRGQDRGDAPGLARVIAYVARHGSK